MTRHSNWIGAQPVEPCAGSYVGRRAPGPRGIDLGQWPRSADADVDRALDALAQQAASAGGGGADPDAQGGKPAAGLLRAAEHLAADPDPDGLSAAAYDLDPSEFGEYVEPVLDELEDLPRPLRRPLRGGAAPRVNDPPLVLRVAGSCGPLVLWFRMWRALSQGRELLVLPDACLGPAANHAAACLANTPGARGKAVCVLHQESEEVTRALATHPTPAELEFVGPAAAAAEFEDFVAQARKEALANVSSRSRPFGLGVSGGGRRKAASIVVLHPATLEVGPDEDPSRVARRLVRLAFGRDWALGGWDAQALRRVRVAPGLLSELSACLLDELEHERGADPAPWPMVKKLDQRLHEARRIGLGEGATLIHEGSRPSRGGGPSAILTRLVFTNVEDHMALTKLRFPLPLLLLERSAP